MQGSLTTESLSLAERVVLLTIAEAEVADEQPVASLDIKSRAETLFQEADADVMGSPDEATIMRALAALGAEPYITEAQSTTSSVGKGRPNYALDTAPESVFRTLEADDRLESVIDIVRD